MNDELKEEIEAYIEHWYWDEPSKELAFDIGKFLFAFINYLKDQDLSDRTKQRHIDNVYVLGRFEAQYGLAPFKPENLAEGPHYVTDFELKISDSPTAVKSYEATCRKLNKFIDLALYKEYLQKLEQA